ncbi:hypothetical protein ACJJTC_007776 [Scirpophaga incertulas]
MADSTSTNIDKSPKGDTVEGVDPHITISATETQSVTESVKTNKTHRISSSSERQVKYERAQKALQNAALVSKRIKEHRKATAELLGRPFEDDDIGETAEMASTISERTGFSAATDTSTTLSVQDALNIPGISESLANTLKQKELLMERIKQYKEISKRPIKTPIKKESLLTDIKYDTKKTDGGNNSNQLLTTIKEKENAISILHVKIKAMETTILDLQEKINEKDQIIESKNIATTLMSDSLSKKEKDSLILLEDTKLQMTKMQENFVIMEAEWKEEKHKLLHEIELKAVKIKNLEEANTILENSRFEITVANSKLLEEIEMKNKEICELQDRVKTIKHEQDTPEITLIEKDDSEEEKGSLEISKMIELTKKIELLEQINIQIRQTNIELEQKLANVNADTKSGSQNSPSKKGSPLPSRKGGRNTASKLKSPWSNLSSESTTQETEKKTMKNEISKLESLVQSLNKNILDKEYIISQKDENISKLQTRNEVIEAEIADLKSQIIKSIDDSTDTIDMGISEESQLKSDEFNKIAQDPLNNERLADLEEKLNKSIQQIASLNEEIELANKNMIKVKSSHKLKLKQMQKTIDNFSKTSDANAEIVRLNEELHQLSQKVAELEEEKGNLQLHLVDYDSGRMTETDIYKKMIEMENLAETRLKAISVLEAQKFDLVQDLHILQQKNMEIEDKLADITQLQNEQVCSEMKSVQLEEQIDELIASRNELQLVIQNLNLDKDQLNDTIKFLQEEKVQMIQKLENYVQENIDLSDKLEKLSAEKVSSAESIEIVESLTTQEKLELEEYNKRMTENKQETILHSNKGNVQEYIEQIEELNKKIDLFTQERQEVMDKMMALHSDNDKLHDDINRLNNECTNLKSNIDLLTREKMDLQLLNEQLNLNIEDLKRNRQEIIKETAEIAKPVVMEDNQEQSIDSQQDDKNIHEKGVSRAKSVKQLTKEILKLKNVIKEREAEIADSQMKILSLEEQHQKQNDLIQNNVIYENKLKLLTDENHALKESLEKNKGEPDELLAQLKDTNNSIQKELISTRQEYTRIIEARDARILELENILLEYEKQIFNYGNTLQQKDKEIVEYMNQLTKLNDVSQKLKSTIELLEEEKAKDQNADMIKSLNKQISSYQKKLFDHEEKLKMLEEEKCQLLTIKTALDSKNMNIESELKKLQELYAEKQCVIKEMQAIQEKHAEEVSNVKLQAKERDEEIHEIKLQLRKESIENEKLRTILAEKEKNLEEYTITIDECKSKINELTTENLQFSDQYNIVETKNKELMEKLKKFAANFKKKSSLFTDLENQYQKVLKQLEAKNQHMEQYLIQIETLPALEEKLKHADEELNRLRSQKVAAEQNKVHEIENLNENIHSLQNKIISATEEISRLNTALNSAHEQLHETQGANKQLTKQIDVLNKKMVEHEIEQKNNLNFITKISTLESDINQKQSEIYDLLQKLENNEQILKQLNFAHDAKLQERDLYIESLESEINRYKNRIYRLEESISLMEDRRHSLERKADQLDTQLQEKQQAYIEYSTQEDELINRLAALIDHDRVVEKQLHEIEAENRQLQDKIQHTTEDNMRLKKSISDIQEHYNNLLDKANRTELAESEMLRYESQLKELDISHKRIIQGHQALLLKKTEEFEELEAEFNTQIENAIKEKKIISEKCEKSCENVALLEKKVQELRIENERIKINMDELNRINQELLEKYCNGNQQLETPDYTEQYISEINQLNSVLTSKGHEINELKEKLHSQEVKSSIVTSEFKNKISDLTSKLQKYLDDLTEQSTVKDNLQYLNDQLQQIIIQKDEQIKELKDIKTMTFEMNIPKTEGMIISSTIEALNVEEPVQCNIDDLESQTSSNPKYDNKQTITTNDRIEKETSQDLVPVSEEIIVPKKTYMCYKRNETNAEEVDPFNSDEGWGFGEPEEMSEAASELCHLNETIQKLQKEKDVLKNDLDVTNTKLLKVMKKFKEIKANNEILTNELKLSKQLSQSSFLDSAIEDELRNNAKDLEKQLNDLNINLVKERNEKERLIKQNEIICNANEKLTEIKEKLDSEVELWKYKFKEVNDKMIKDLDWSEEGKGLSEHKDVEQSSIAKNESIKDDVVKLEKENDELQILVDNLTIKNNELITQQTNLKCELDSLRQNLIQKDICINCEELNSIITKLEKEKSAISEEVQTLKDQFSLLDENYAQKIQSNEKVIADYSERTKQLEIAVNELSEKRSGLENDLHIAQTSDSESAVKVEALLSEIEYLKLKISQETLNDKLNNEDKLKSMQRVESLENDSLQLKCELEETKKKLEASEKMRHDLECTCSDLQKTICDLKDKIENLNSENDQLLSTVTELRSSISSAVDQRGFEIAELWKQHLAQREADFVKIEQELRSELTASEAKYEQLLETVQCSDQEETNKLIMMEQVTSLQNKLQDKDDHLRNIQDKYAEIMSQIDVLRSEEEDEKVIYENKLLSQQDEYEKIIYELKVNNEKNIENSDLNLNKINNLLTTANVDNENLKLKIDTLHEDVKRLELSTVDLNNQLIAKENEIYQKSHEYSLALTQRNEEFENIRKQLYEYEKKIEDLCYEKESELAVLRLKMHENVERYEKSLSEIRIEKSALADELKSKIIECTNLNKQIVDLNKHVEEHVIKAAETHTALENQELEIVTLKDEIFTLQQMMNKTSSKIEKHVTFATDTKLSTDSDNSEELVNRELLDAVPRAELDLALYMLHQRDVRCEELTMELTQLLEERDTLQLRLSDSLRSNEELKAKCKAAEIDFSVDSQETVSELPSFVSDKESPFIDIHRGQSSRSSSISDIDPEKPKLQAKLSELRSVKHSRDVRLRQESEQRQMDLRLLQRDVANLPPEAVDQLAQAHHTLSRDSQSTSTVLLNWLRGKSTPKVVHM